MIRSYYVGNNDLRQVKEKISILYSGTLYYSKGDPTRKLKMYDSFDGCGRPDSPVVF